MKTEHRTIEELLVYLENPIGSKEDETIEEHLAECDKCVSDLSFLDTLRIGLEQFGQNSRELVETGESAHLTNEEIPKYIKEACNENEKRRIVSHLAGCSSCLDDVFTVKKLTTQLEREPALTKKSYLLSRFIISRPARMASVEKEGKDLIREAARHGIALFDIGRSLSFSFQGAETSEEKTGEDYRKMETDDFTIEIVQPACKVSNVIIGVLARGDLKNAKVTICAEEEKSEIVSLDNRRAIINKDNMQAEAIRYIRVDKM
ncbi:MAG: hypothetical protein SCARUB_00754 [Candidatus Scalindua rubra]|uniref:Zinc-finger domain-containing protein n=1 Tax=Candidatus Scalindua rubra TaxID=1872076 RepID=A0A1E3XEK7_9BACT|nr:MAG: hypothetical protein SCARUB_00754 [Candidatus Scalindua rubra]